MSEQKAPGVYAQLQDLVALQYKARGFSFLPRQPIHSLLAGRHASRMRGRGLNFEEIRGYLPGDDPRTIDWKITARTREPHVRVYSEERDRPALLIVDQRLSMFFGSRTNMKSVTAAEAAALGAWRVFSSGDRIGAIVVDDAQLHEVRPHRSRQTVLRILGTIIDANHALGANGDAERNPSMLNEALQAAERIARHDHLVAIISDFDGLDGETRRYVTRMARHNDVLAIPVFDPLSREVPEHGTMVVSDGELQLELDTTKGTVVQRLVELAGERMQAIMDWQKELGVPVIPLSTDGDPVDQLRRLLGQRPGRR